MWHDEWEWRILYWLVYIGIVAVFGTLTAGLYLFIRWIF